MLPCPAASESPLSPGGLCCPVLSIYSGGVGCPGWFFAMQAVFCHLTPRVWRAFKSAESSAVVGPESGTPHPNNRRES